MLGLDNRFYHLGRGDREKFKTVLVVWVGVISMEAEMHYLGFSFKLVSSFYSLNYGV